MIDTKEVYELLSKLIDGNGVSGQEADAADIAEKELSKYMNVRRDALGNVIGETENSENCILLDAHIDQIGMIVTAVTDDGFIKVDKCGGTDIRILSSHEVVVNGKEPVYGIVTSVPPHIAKDEKSVPKWQDISIDVGLSREKARELISVGDRVTFIPSERKLLSDNYSAPSIDDRAGVAAILRALSILKEKNCKRNVSVVFSVQEEVTGAGASAGAYQSDAKTAIAVDVSFATCPDVSDEKGKPLGSGPLVGISPVISKSVSDTFISLAKENGIPYEIEVMGSRTGTNTENYALSKGGRKTGLVSIPIRNMHTAVEVCKLSDIENTAQLLALYIEKGETNT